MAGDRPARLVAAFGATLIALVWLAIPAAPAQTSRGAPESSTPRRFTPAGANPAVWRGSHRLIRVSFVLRGQHPIFGEAARARSILAPAPGRRDRLTLRHASSKGAAQYGRSQAAARTAALQRLDRRAGRADRRQLPLQRAIVLAGGRVLTGSDSVVTATVPRSKLRLLAARTDVQAVAPAHSMRPLDDIASAASASGASTWWIGGHRGGRGSADVAANLAIIQDSIYQPHPAFQGITFETRPGYVQEAPSTGVNGHGTAVLSMAAAQGPSGCSLCQLGDAQQTGTAFGISKVLNP